VVRRHPILLSLLLWSIPALLFGAILRGMLLSYSPYAYWGSDSRSYFGFVHDWFTQFHISLNDKRRYLYPLFLLPVSVLPGAPLRWIAVLQALLGLSGVLPMAYAVRKTFTAWRVGIVPVTLIYAGWPIFLWYEHELLAECVFFTAITWSIGGWVAWISETDVVRKARLWWWFFAPLSVALLTKPAARFFVPGLLLGLLAVGAWRYLRWRAVLAGIAVLGLTAGMGDDDQGVWLLYTSAFPLTQLETPLHAPLKAEVAGLVRESRADLGRYAGDGGEAFKFLRSPDQQSERPLWRELGLHRRERSAVYHDLAREAILAEPLAFLSISLHRALASANPGEFGESRFEADYFAERFGESLNDRRNPASMIQLAFALPRDQSLPTAEEFRQRLAPHPDSRAAVALVRYAHGVQVAGQLFQTTERAGDGLTLLRPTPLGWGLIVSLIATLFPVYFRRLGVWTIIALLYVWGVFLVGVQHPRYFAAVWPILMLALPAAADLLWRCWSSARARSGTNSPS
jgi:hypothetical protein